MFLCAVTVLLCAVTVLQPFTLKAIFHYLLGLMPLMEEGLLAAVGGALLLSEDEVITLLTSSWRQPRRSVW